MGIWWFLILILKAVCLATSAKVDLGDAVFDPFEQAAGMLGFFGHPSEPHRELLQPEEFPEDF